MTRHLVLLAAFLVQPHAPAGPLQPKILDPQDEHPTFMNSIKSGREEADANVAASLYHRANGYSHKAEKIAFDKDGNALRAEYQRPAFAIPPATPP